MIGFTKTYTQYLYYDATVGFGGDYSTIQEALHDKKYKLKLISDVTETVDWGVVSDDILIESDNMFKINLSVINSGNITMNANNVEFVISGTDIIFTSNSLLTLNNCKITGSDEHNFFNALNASTINNFSKFTNVEITTGNGQLLVNGNYFDNITLIGGGTLVYWAIICANGSVSNVQASGTFANFNGGSTRNAIYTNSKCQIRNIQDSSTNFRIFIKDGGTVDNCECNVIEIANDMDSVVIKDTEIVSFIYINANATNKVKSFENSSISGFLYQGYTSGQISLVENFDFCDFSFTPTFLESSIVENCTFTNDLIVTCNDMTINFNEFSAGSIIINPGSTNTNVLANRTLTDITDNGTDSNLIANKLI